MTRLEIGKYLVADKRICSGRLSFKGTRITVADALKLAERGYSPEAIADQYYGIITPEAVKEALAMIRRGVVKEISQRARKAA